MNDIATMSEEEKPTDEQEITFVGEWKIITRKEVKRMRLKQAIRKIFNELDFRCPKCKCNENE